MMTQAVVCSAIRRRREDSTVQLSFKQHFAQHKLDTLL